MYSLQFSKEHDKLLEYIISYGLIDYSKTLRKSIEELDDHEIESIIDYASENDIKIFDKYSEDDLFLLLAYKKLNCNVSSLTTTYNKYFKLKNFISNYEKDWGSDALVSIHKHLLFEVRDGKFNFELFRTYCGILSKLGDKKSLRITNNTINFTMMGFKGKKPFEGLDNIYTPLTVRQIKTRAQKLQQKRLIDFITYRNREIYYSRLYKGEELNKLISEKIINRKLKKEMNPIRSQNLDRIVSQKLQSHKNELLLEGVFNLN